MLHLRIYLENYFEAQDDELSFVDYEGHFKNAPCNLYIIGCRPRVIIDPNYLLAKGDSVELLFKIQEDFNFKEAFGTLKLDRPIVGQLIIESDKPHSRFNLKDENGYFLHGTEYQNKKDLELKANYALRNSETTFDKKIFTDFKTLYIGESLKMHKKISPVKRLQSHSKFQKILSRCTSKYIDKEIYVFLCSFIGKVDLRAVFENDNQMENRVELVTNAIKKASFFDTDTKLITSIAEASLIDYFNTNEFNSDFIGSFGQKNHNYYKAISNYEITSLSVEIDLNKIGRIYSDTVAPNWHHGIQYDISNNYERMVFNHNIDSV
jgi:hypothetical protein